MRILMFLIIILALIGIFKVCVLDRHIDFQFLPSNLNSRYMCLRIHLFQIFQFLPLKKTHLLLTGMRTISIFVSLLDHAPFAVSIGAQFTTKCAFSETNGIVLRAVKWTG